MNTLVKKTNGNMPATSFSGMVDRLFQNTAGRILEDDFWGFNGVNPNVNVPVNIKETEKSYELQLVVPGLKKEDLKVGLNKDLLTVSFEQHQEHTDQSKQDGWIRKEYQNRSFSRSFSLDDAIDATRIEAKYTDGILFVTLPKKEGAQAVSRHIEIR